MPMTDGLSPNSPTALRTVLQENLDDMLNVIDAMTPEELDARLDEDCWSAREILLHVIHSERWLQPQLLAIRHAVAPALSVPPDDSVTLPSPDAGPDLNELRWALNAVREGTERLLDGLSPQQLREPANLPGDEVGDDASVDVSFRTMLLTAADHQLFHVRQLQQTLGRR
jgi:uncharacterized damage-inducible protein DinB